jgi:hypothetical protein
MAKSGQSISVSPPVIWIKYEKGMYLQCAPGSDNAFAVVPKQFFDNLLDHYEVLFSTLESLREPLSPEL